MRIANRVLSTLLGLALAVAGGLVLVNLVLSWQGRPWWPEGLHAWARGLTFTPWTDGTVRIVAGCALLAGLLLLAMQLRQWPPAYLPMDVPEGGGGWQIRRRSAEHHLAAAAASVPGAHDAAVALRSRKGAWYAVVTADAPGDLRTGIERSVRDAMSAIGAPVGSLARVRLQRSRRAG